MPITVTAPVRTRVDPWVAFVGKARSGKDTAAAVLTAAYGFRRVAFADPVRQALLALDPWITGERLSALVERDGWEGAKKDPEVRALLQRMGTEAIRALDPDFWVRQGIRAAEAWAGPTVFTDARFHNELEAIRGAGGLLVRIDRPGVGSDPRVDAHPSEQEWTSWRFDVVLQNDGSLADFHLQVRRLVEDYFDLSSYPHD